MNDKKESKQMAYTSAEQWGLFSKSYKSAWHEGFNLVPHHAQDSDLVKVPLVLATIIHLANFGIFTALIPALCKTTLDLVSRIPLTEDQFLEVQDFLSRATNADIEQVVQSLTENPLAPKSNSSVALIKALRALTKQITDLKEAIYFYNSKEPKQNVDNNPKILEKRTEQKELLKNYFSARTNLGKKTQQLIAVAVQEIKQKEDQANSFSHSFSLTEK